MYKGSHGEAKPWVRRAQGAWAVVVALSVVACGGEDCPDVSGAWEITSHCEADYVGTPVDIEVDGCVITTFGDFEGWRGDVGSDGTIQVSGPIGEGTIACEGEIPDGDDVEIDLECDDGCVVRLSPR